METVDYTPLDAMHRGNFGPDRRRRLRKQSLTHKVIYAWFNMGRSTTRLINQQPSEWTLLLMLAFTDMAFFLSWTMKAVIVPNEAGVSVFSVEIGYLFLLALFGRTAAMYLFAMFMGASCRIFGGRGSWRNTRIAVFWASFVTAPFGVIGAILSVAFSHLAIYYPIFSADWIALPPYYVGLLPLVWYTSAAVARVQGFTKVSPLFLTMSVLSLVAVLGGMYFHAKGMI